MDLYQTNDTFCNNLRRPTDFGHIAYALGRVYETCGDEVAQNAANIYYRTFGRFITNVYTRQR
jgi:hypothetical protein